MKVDLRLAIFSFALLAMLETPALAAGVYAGCAAPPTTFVKTLTATPTTFSSILNTAAAGDVIDLNWAPMARSAFRTDRIRNF